MATLPASLKQIALFLERLPGIGEKTANRLAMYLLRMPEVELQAFGEAVRELKKRTKLCKQCLNLTEDELCSICMDNRKDISTITVVETVLDLLSFETGNIYNGLYHVLHGKIDPLNSVGPDEIYINHLLTRVKGLTSSLKEIILATNPDMEGEATAMYIKKQLERLKEEDGGLKFKITRLAYGLPMGANLEYADYGTLGKAIEGRRDY
ncbi:recombination protein RecR [Candidatus Roizmanbacteria bacterium CG_4_10_14_0_8_um_filter_39_9]|uniref:Recombination protein RecR n=1 Tax=Candidatus Roizmanbacteria bacterium CG_4_10_14_0_8_um_filter_39_9 TaxID=1974829 RepID=A0A2M7QDY0_9BACT|nr:MAG: recombination protein RecR [Candidatus Roizmanbacteria bacterium CG_4_10_14_0_8_um_filter_39_9]